MKKRDAVASGYGPEGREGRGVEISRKGGGGRENIGKDLYVTAGRFILSMPGTCSCATIREGSEPRPDIKTRRTLQ